jgi:hypothetical protein
LETIGNEECVKKLVIGADVALWRGEGWGNGMSKEKGECVGDGMHRVREFNDGEATGSGESSAEPRRFGKAEDGGVEGLALGLQSEEESELWREGFEKREPLGESGAEEGDLFAIDKCGRAGGDGLGEEGGN